jgi:undecaprenyl-diphosphatase
MVPDRGCRRGRPPILSTPSLKKVARRPLDVLSWKIEVPMSRIRNLVNFVASRDLRLADLLREWSPPRTVRVWMVSSSRAGDGWLWAALGIPVLWYGGEQRYRVLAVLTLAAATGIGLFSVLKRVTVRKRPCAMQAFTWFQKLPPDHFSFPSGHSLTAFAVTVPLSLYYPSYMYGLYFCAASIATSRVILGMHFLSDVVAGSAIGAGIGYMAYSLAA